MDRPGVAPVQGGYRVFAWRTLWAGTANFSGLAADGRFVAGVSVTVG
jgi:hypothetical protein